MRRQAFAVRLVNAGILTLLCCGLFLVSRQVLAVPDNSIDKIETAALDYLHQTFGPQDEHTQYEVGRLDSRLKLDDCQGPLQVTFPVGARQLGYTTVAVACTHAASWKIHVPVTIRRFAEVLVAKRHLPRGSVLQSSDLHPERRDLARLTSGYFSTPDEVLGLVVTRNLRQSRVITPSAVEQPRLIRRGDDITIQSGSRTLTINVKGRALMDGRLGEKIRVKNQRSKRELQATVVGPGLVSVSN